MQLLHTAHVPAGNGPFPTLLTLHGWGASAHDLLGLAPVFPDGVMTLCPQGKVEVPIGPGAVGYGWFPLVPGQPAEPEAFRQGSGLLRSWVEEARSRYPVDRARTVVLGFSQGGVMGLDLVLRAPERFAALIVLSSWLPEPLAADLPELAAHRGLPVLVVHGTRDTMVAVDKARATREALERFRLDLTYEEFEMGHEIRPEALRRVLRWLDEKVLKRG